MIASPDFGQAQADAQKAATDLAQAEKNRSRLHDLAEHGVVAVEVGAVGQGHVDLAVGLRGQAHVRHTDGALAVDALEVDLVAAALRHFLGGDDSRGLSEHQFIEVIAVGAQTKPRLSSVAPDVVRISTTKLP